MNIPRRNFLLMGGLGAAALYINQRGLRYPRMGFAPNSPDSEANFHYGSVKLQDCIFAELNTASSSEIGDGDTHLSTRAYSPSPNIKITPSSKYCTVLVNNVSPLSELSIKGTAANNIVEQVSGINRQVEIKNSSGRNINLEWKTPFSEHARFVVVGDTGGGTELDWCIRRASELGAQFLFHLGDFNYSKGEYQRAIKAFHEAPLPIYVSIGNHDFNDKGLVYHHFLNQIGPLNTSFQVADTRLINLDTAASFFPSYAGNRGRFVRSLLSSPSALQAGSTSDSVVLTHKPFIDTRDSGDHTMSGVNEQNWFLNTMHSLDAATMICGHVHRSTAINHQGINQITAGEGLGFEDIRHQRKSAKIMVAETNKNERFSYEWENLNMPWEAHTSPTHIEKLRRPELKKQQRWFEELGISKS